MQSTQYLAALTIFLLASVRPDLFASQTGTQFSKSPLLPENMDCEKLRGDKELPPNSRAMIVKRAQDYYVCYQKSDAILASAKTAAITIRSVQTISCGDGSNGDCIREDATTKEQIENWANSSDLWRYFERQPASKADIILQFVANDRASSSPQIILLVQHSDSNTQLYYEARTIGDLQNDVNQLVNHFLVSSGRASLMTKEDSAKTHQCAAAADQLSALKKEYQQRLNDFNFKRTHLLDAQMDECNLHWKEWVCLKRGGTDGGVSYAAQWSESGQELQRKLSLEFEGLGNLEQQIGSASQGVCTSNAAKENGSLPDKQTTGASGTGKVSWKNLNNGHFYTTQLTGEKLHLELIPDLPSVTADIVSCDFSQSPSIGISWLGTCMERNRADQSVSSFAEYITLFSNARIESPKFVLVPAQLK